MIADHEAVNGRKNFLVILLKEKLHMKGLREEVKTYLQTHTYVDATKHSAQVAERLRYTLYNFIYFVQNLVFWSLSFHETVYLSGSPCLTLH